MTHAGLSYRMRAILLSFIRLSERVAPGPHSGPGTLLGLSRDSLGIPCPRASRLPRIHVFAFALLFVAAAASHAFAQTTSTIEGTVKDANGAAIVGATIKVTGSELGTERSATTNSNGEFRIPALPAGKYTVNIAQSGFANRVVENVELTLNRTLTLDVQLEVGAVQEKVGVTAAEQLLEPTASSIGGTVTPRQIVDLPVNGRNYLDLLQ